MTLRSFFIVLTVVLLLAVERQVYAAVTVSSEFPVEIYANGAEHHVMIPAYVVSYGNGDNWW